MTSFITDRLSGPARRPLALSLAALLVLLGIQWLCFDQGVPFAALTRDPTAHLRVPPYIGLLSEVGCVGWGVATGLAAFGWTKLRRAPGYEELARLLGMLSLLTGLLGLDDLAQLHEEVYPRLFLPEKVVFLLYGLVALAWLLRFRAILMARVRVPLLLAMGFFGISILADVLPVNGSSFQHLLEDGAKMLGIVNWVYMTLRLVGSSLIPLDRVPE